MNKEINVTISGVHSSGKSHITYLIKKTLKENGFEVNFEPDVDYGPTESHFDRKIIRNNEKAIVTLSDSTKININQHQLNRLI